MNIIAYRYNSLKRVKIFLIISCIKNANEHKHLTKNSSIYVGTHKFVFLFHQKIVLRKKSTNIFFLMILKNTGNF